jgi:chloramphenicol 3-O phosphotransferase
MLLSMEPHPPDRGPGRIIFLNGASGSGTSTLAKAMQEPLPEPFLHVSPDHPGASGMLPARCDPDGPSGWWQQMRPRFFDGFHRCLPALAAAGNDLIVEHITESAPGASTWPRCSTARMSSSSACTAIWPR